jgi:L-fuconolactonase
MVQVDSHCHASELFFEPVELLVYQMERNDVQHAALIQMRGQYDNRYQEECIRRFPGKFSSVVTVDVQRNDALVALDDWVKRGAVGVRLRVDDSEAVWRHAAKLGIAVSAQGGSAGFASEQFTRLVEQFQTMPIVLEHYAGMHRLGRADGPSHEVANKVLGLATYPNVSIKVHGLGEFSERALPMTPDFPFVRPIPNVLDRIATAFGADKMMWGSDFPPCSIREGYRNVLQLTRAVLESKYSAEDLGKIFGGNALRVFPINSRA